MKIAFSSLRMLLEASLDLSPELGTVTVTTKNQVLTHRSDKPLKGQLHVASEKDRLIPSSFSLGLSGHWWAFGNTITRFRLKKGARMLVVSYDQFYNWGPELCTPLERGREIQSWAIKHGIDVIKTYANGIEYAVLNTSMLEQL